MTEIKTSGNGGDPAKFESSQPSNFEAGVVGGVQRALDSGKGPQVSNPHIARNPGGGERVMVSHDGRDIIQVGVVRDNQ